MTLTPPDGRPDMRPEYPSIVYTQILKNSIPMFPSFWEVLEASMRHLSHYDYWQDRLKKSILCESGADMLIYGMGEKPICELVRRLTALCDNQGWSDFIIRHSFSGIILYPADGLSDQEI